MQSNSFPVAKEKIPTVAFRVDASNQIGTGHITRCLTLADKLTATGMQCVFICRSYPGDMICSIRKQGYKTFELPKRNLFELEPYISSSSLEHADWLGADWLTDAEQTASILNQENATWLIVDHYAIDIKWEQYVRPFIKFICIIDDLANRLHNCEILIDQNWFGPQTYLRYETKVNADCLKLLGPKYAILKNIYLRSRKFIKKKSGYIKTVLIFFGGSDQENQTEKTLKALSNIKFKEINVDIVVGSNYLKSDELSKLALLRPRTNIYKNLPDLSDLMMKADLMIGAGGSTTWERMCLGLPSLIISIASNQTQICRALNDAGFINYLGEMNVVDIYDLEQSIIQIMNKQELLKRQSEQMLELVDGCGTTRIIETFQLVASQKND